MKFGVSPQKLGKYRWQTPIWASICTLVAPSPIISSGHSPRLGGTSSHLGGTPRNAPPCRRAWSHEHGSPDIVEHVLFAAI